MLEPAEEGRLSRPSLGGDSVSAVFDSVERKYGVLDVQCSLRAFFRPRALPGVHFESYLFMRSASRFSGQATWLRRWFMLEG